MKYITTFDLETTGTDTSKDKIVQIAISRRDLTTGISESFETLVNPEMDIPKEASDIHGVTNEMVKSAPLFSEIALNVLSYFNEAFISGFNHEKFDIPLLVEELARVGIKPTCFHPKKIIDISNIYRHFNPRTLSACYKQYTGMEIDNAHNAMADVQATEKIFMSMLNSDLKDVSNIDSELVENQIITLEGIISISKFIEENKLVNSGRVDFDRKFKKDDNGDYLFDFGKHKGKIVKTELGYLEWMLKNGDFTSNTKQWCQHFLEKK